MFYPNLQPRPQGFPLKKTHFLREKPWGRGCQTYRDLYGGAMLVLTRKSSLNMADGNKQKHLLPSFATKASGNLFFEKLINIK